LRDTRYLGDELLCLNDMLERKNYMKAYRDTGEESQ